MRDNDDFSTILEAYKYKCQFVDNDNYRDWGVRIKDPEVAKWYGQNKTHLHVAYYFDRFGNFTPLKGATPKQTEGAKAASASYPSVGGEKRPPMPEAGLGPLQKRPRPDAGDLKAQVPVSKQQPIQLGPEIYDDADAECCDGER